MRIRRRELLKTVGFALLLRTPLAPARFAAASGGEPFDFARLKGRARGLAAVPYQAPESPLPETLASLDYDRYQAIRFRPERALWASQDLPFRVQFFHRGFRVRNRVRIHEVVGGVAREIAYDPAMFDLRKAGVASWSLRRDLGFAGLRINFHLNWTADVATFLDASYFRAVGASLQYGLSARGLAIDTGLESGEEFPVFREFWLVRPQKGAGRVTLYALLDSPGITGAYRFDLTPGEPLVMDVDAALYPRRPIRRLGIAPLTSMYLYGENDRRAAGDWRPEVHDSDGLSLWTGAGEWIWRPVVNPEGIRFNSFLDDNPRGFGLMQRDRAFDHFQDDGARYERRPSLWVEPRAGAGGGWGRGAVQLMEMNAHDETVDNIVAFWNPAQAPQPGEELLFAYRLYWGERMPFASPLARVVATRTGLGGVVGRPREYFSWRFAVDFVGGGLMLLGRKARVRPVISASRGRAEITSARPQKDIRGYRAMFDLRPPDDGTEPIDLRMFLQVDGQPLTETWVYQWTPPPPGQREALVRAVNGA